MTLGPTASRRLSTALVAATAALTVAVSPVGGNDTNASTDVFLPGPLR